MSDATDCSGIIQNRTRTAPCLDHVQMTRCKCIMSQLTTESANAEHLSISWRCPLNLCAAELMLEHDLVVRVQASVRSLPKRHANSVAQRHSCRKAPPSAHNHQCCCYQGIAPPSVYSLTTFGCHVVAQAGTFPRMPGFSNVVQRVAVQ
jgi:hypothetical protein